MIENIKDAKEQLEDYFGSKKELKEATEDEVSDAMFELADSNCDIYYSAILKWVAKDNNYFKVEEAIDELGVPETDGKPDFIKIITQGQWIANKELLQEAREELKLWFFIRQAEG